LDIGCGDGRTSYILKNIAGAYLGVDCIQEMIDVCKRKFGEEYFRRADVRDLSFLDDSSFDFALFSFNGFDCIGHEGRLTGLKEIHRVLRPDKLLVFSSHNRNHKNIQQRPRLKISLNPIDLARGFYDYIVTLQRYHRNRKKEFFCPEYAVIRDPDQGFANLYYYIGRKEQIAQARLAGFRVIDMYDVFGNPLLEDSDDSDSPWIYYVARKT
jgi:SAM-dependent methyltransferase